MRERERESRVGGGGGCGGGLERFVKQREVVGGDVS